jgi:ABC-2 type transport system permease protein
VSRAPEPLASRGEAPVPRGPATARVIGLIARLSALRVVNRLSVLRARRRRPGERAATGRKPATGRLLLSLFGIFFVLQTIQGTSRLVHQTSLAAERRADPARLALPSADYWQLQAAPPERREAVLRELARNELDVVASEEELNARGEVLVQRLREHGIEAFRASELPPMAAWPNRDLWYGKGDPLDLLRPLALAAFSLGLAQILQHVAGSDDDLARVEASLEWLFSFPVPARALFLARALSAVFSGPLVWLLLLPFYAVCFWCAGYGWGAIPLGIAAAVYLALLAGGLRVLLETTLRRFLPLTWVSRVQALLLMSSGLSMLGGIALAYSRHTDALSAWLAQLPRWAFYLPPSLPIWLVERGLGAGMAAAASLSFAAAWLPLSVLIAERMVRPGLVNGGGPLVGARGSAFAAPSLFGLPSSNAFRKELRALFRDRRLRAQALFTPILAFGLQVWVNPRLASSISQSPRHCAAAAFAVGAFTLTTGACNALATEGQALWLLYTTPVTLERALLQKLGVWLGVAYSFTAALIAFVWWHAPRLIVPSLPYVALALVGLGIYAVIALGVGSLGTDPLEHEPRRRIRPGSLYLFMLLASLFAYALFVPSWWTKCVQLALSALLAFALWQKLRDQLPYLLDPTAAPAPDIAVADGVIAALAFFVLQGVFALTLGDNVGSEGLTLLFGFCLAGVTVTLLALFALRQSGVPHLFSRLGLVRRPGSRSRFWQIGIGVLGGLVAASVAAAYGLVAKQLPWLEELFQRASELGPLRGGRKAPPWFWALAVVAAPLFEEFIFRGILYQGLRRSVRVPTAVLASALVFALVHPAVAAPPVFVMAVLAASAYERSGWLLTPIATHMTYNALVIGASVWLE